MKGALRLAIGFGISAVLLCWLLFSAAIFGFAKTTEDPVFRAAATAHPLLGDAHVAVGVFAAIASVALLIGAVPLVVLALAQARRRPEIRRAVLTAVGCILALVVATAAVVLVANHDPAPSDGVVTALLVGWACVGIACAFGCALAARRGLFAATLPTGALRLAGRCAALVTVAMAGIALATLLYLVELVAAATDLASAPNGPLGNPDVRVSLLLALAVMVAATIPAALGARRAWRGAAI